MQVIEISPNGSTTNPIIGIKIKFDTMPMVDTILK